MGLEAVTFAAARIAAAMALPARSDRPMLRTRAGSTGTPAAFAGNGEDDMTTRRDFIGGAMAGAAFVGCDLLNTAHVHA